LIACGALTDRAKREPDPRTKCDFLEMERRWLNLAHSYQLLDRLGVFTAYNSQRRAELSRRLERLNWMISKTPPAETAETTFKTTKTYILDQRLRIDRQRELIAKLERDGDAQSLADARWRLTMMEKTLARMEAEAAASGSDLHDR
jgi:hypothetical protein